MSDNHKEEITVVTSNEKPKNPNRVNWARKLGQMNKGKKKILTEENTSNYNMYYYTSLLIGGIGLAAFVWYYTKEDKPIQQQSETNSKPKKSKLEI